MAKRKRASLKDQDPETLGLTSKKGKGIDLLFGGPVDAEAEQDSNADDDDGTATEVALTEADSANVGAVDNRAVDELGLPVALEEPPDDLIPASAPAGAVSAAGETDAVDPAISPFALPDTEVVRVVADDDPNDLSGIQTDENTTTGEDETLANSTDPNDLSGILNDDTLAGSSDAEDLAGIAEDSGGLAGVAAAPAPGTPVLPPTPTAANNLAEADEDLSGLIEDVNSPSAAPTTAAPINVPASPTSISQPGSAPPITPSGGAFTPATPPLGPSPTPTSNLTPPSTATGAPNLSPPRTTINFQGIDPTVGGVLSTLGEVLPDNREAFLPQDELPDQRRALTVRERAQVERDEAITKQVLDYIGPERRDDLFEEIQAMHEQVANELSSNSTDVQFALNTLQEANDIIIEDPRQYDEALYRVSLVKAMLHRRKNLSFWSYRVGLLVFLYGVFWALAAIGGALLAYVNYPLEVLSAAPEGDLTPMFVAVWYSAIAGALGGAVEVLWRLYYRVSIKQDFDKQYLMYYLVKPILGLVLGMVMYFLVAAAASLTGTAEMPMPGTTTGFVFSLILGFVAGYRQETVFDMIYVLFKRIGPKTDPGGKKSMIPVDLNTDSSGN